MRERFETVDAYVGSFPPATQEALQSVRGRLRAALPGAVEAINYGIPVLKVDGKDLVYFAGFKQHLSVYPVTDTDPELEAELAPYRGGKGTVKFPLGEPVPDGLLERIVAFLLSRRAA